jgi:hypothetical protein
MDFLKLVLSKVKHAFIFKIHRPPHDDNSGDTVRISDKKGLKTKEMSKGGWQEARMATARLTFESIGRDRPGAANSTRNDIVVFLTRRVSWYTSRKNSSRRTDFFPTALFRPDDLSKRMPQREPPPRRFRNKAYCFTLVRPSHVYRVLVSSMLHTAGTELVAARVVALFVCLRAYRPGRRRGVSFRDRLAPLSILRGRGDAVQRVKCTLCWRTCYFVIRFAAVVYQPTSRLDGSAQLTNIAHLQGATEHERVSKTNQVCGALYLRLP